MAAVSRISLVFLPFCKNSCLPLNFISFSFLALKMPRQSKRMVLLSELGDAVVSHHVFANVRKLLVDTSDIDSEDEEVVSTKVLAAVQYAALMSCRYLYRGTSYHSDVRGKMMGYPMP